jgi:hypothetical protein
MGGKTSMAQVLGLALLILPQALLDQAVLVVVPVTQM